MGAGAMPSIGSVSAEGEKAILESLHGPTAKAKAQPKPAKKPDEATEVKPLTVKEQATAAMPDILKAATEARKHALALKHLNYAGELVNGLMSFSKKMETIYENIQKHQSSNDEGKFKKFMAAIGEQFAWYKQAEVGHTNMTIS